MHPLYANALSARLYVVRCTLHVARCTRSYRVAFIEIELQLTISIDGSLAALQLERASAEMANCVTGLASWRRRRTATCNVPRIVRLATQHSLCLCLCVLVCVGQWPDPFNKSVAILTRQGLSPPPPPATSFATAAAVFPLGQNGQLTYLMQGVRRAAWGMRQATTETKTMHAATCLRSSARPKQSQRERERETVLVCVARIRIVATGNWQLVDGACVALSAAAWQICQRSLALAMNSIEPQKQP